MKKRGDYLKKAYYHLMKIEQKKNKIFGVENYGEINAELNRKFAKGEYFDYAGSGLFAIIKYSLNF